MNSGNHVMLLGDLLVWYYEDLAGIKNHPESIAYKKLLMEPKFPEGLQYVKATYQSARGDIHSEWRKDENGFSWNITIPGNSSAIVRLPKELNITPLEGEGVRSFSHTNERVEIELGSGTYTIVNNNSRE